MPEALPLDITTANELELLSKIRLIVADLDGTLLDPTWAVVDLIQDMIPRLRRRGIRFTIATGRAFRGVSSILPRLALPAKTPIALYNGSLCIDAAMTQVVYTQLIPAHVAQRFAVRALAKGLPVLCYPTLQRSKGELSECPLGFTLDGHPSSFPEPNGYDVPWLAPNDTGKIPDCLAVLVDLRGSPSRITVDEFHGDLDLSITQSGLSFLEVRPRGSDKGRAVVAIARRLQLPMEAVLAIGDNDNDIEMLRASAVGIAVGNASENLRRVAHYTTPRPSAQGCLQVMRLVISAHRYAAPFRDGGY